MTLGNSESITIKNGKLVLRTHQSIMAVELDGARKRKVSVQLIGN